MPANASPTPIFDRYQPDQPATVHEMPSLADETLASIRDRMDNPEHGICTGTADLGGYLARLHPGALYVLAAHPGVPRTAWALHLARGVVSFPEVRQRTLYVSLDEDRVDVIKMLAAAVGKLDFRSVDQGTLPEVELPKLDATMQKLRGLPLEVMDPLALNVDQLRAVVQQRVEPWDSLGLVVVDNLQLLLPTGRPTDGHVAREALRRLKLMAVDHQVPVLVLVDVPDLGEVDPGSSTVDARVLAEVGQAADAVLRLRCTGRADAERTLDMQIDILRNRHGLTGDVPMHYNLESLSYSMVEDAAG